MEMCVIKEEVGEMVHDNEKHRKIYKISLFFIDALTTWAETHTFAHSSYVNLTTACSNVYVHNPLNNRAAPTDVRHRISSTSRAYVNHTRIKCRCESVVHKRHAVRSFPSNRRVGGICTTEYATPSK